eukprot:10953612-Lingulodinium_polyedra.AAC.1
MQKSVFALRSVFVERGSRGVRSLAVFWACFTGVFETADVPCGLLCPYERVFACSPDTKVRVYAHL